MDINRIIREEVNDFDWIKDVDITVPYVGMRFLGPMVIGKQHPCTVTDVSKHMVTFSVDGRYNNSRPYKDFVRKLEKGIFKIIRTMSESDDFKWVDDIPEAEDPVTEKNIRIGLGVILSKNSQYFKVMNDDYNPKHTPGKIDEFLTDDYPHIVVTWDNGLTNSYEHEDLAIYHKHQKKDQNLTQRINDIMNTKKTIQEEVNDFEWAEEVPASPIQVGQRFTDVTGLECTISMVEGDDVTVEWGNLGNDTYPREEIEEYFREGLWNPIGDLQESNDFEWADEIEPLEEFNIGGHNDDIPIVKVTIGDRVSSYGDYDTYTYEFTIEEVKRDHHNKDKDKVDAVWGSDIPEDDRYSGSGDKNNWHYVEYLRKV